MPTWVHPVLSRRRRYYSITSILAPVVLSLTVLWAPAAAAVPETVLAAADEQALAADRRWLNLLRYEPRVFGISRRGAVVTAGFYLAPGGDRDPAAELEATLAALYLPVEPGAEEDHAACRYPARRRFLAEQIGFDHGAAPPPRPACRDYEAWRQRVDAQRVVLIFADAYMGNPASMFGHTLLRLDAQGGTRHMPLTAFAVNHAAYTEEDSGIIFALRGVFGGYPGIYSVLPYYEKVNEYTHLENRDLWEYELHLDEEAIDRLMAHLWELDEIGFPYYFFFQNCSYRLLSLLEVADPDLDLIDRFSVWTIPTDTVRAVVEQEGLLAGVHYRPSVMRTLDHALHGLSRSDQEKVEALARGELKTDAPALTARPDAERAHLLEAAYLYLDLLAQLEPLGEAARTRRHALLIARSRVRAEPLPPPPVPKHRPDHGHPTQRAGIAVGRYDGVDYAALQWRASYHDLLDPPEGYLRGAQIAFLETEVRAYRDIPSRSGHAAGEDVELERLRILDLRSLSPRGHLFRKWSWGTRVGIQRHRDPATGERPLMAEAGGHFGPAWGIGEGITLYAATEGELRGSGRLEDNYRAGAGARFEALYTSHPVRLRLSARALRFHDAGAAGDEDDGDAWRVAAEAGIRITGRTAVRFTAAREEDYTVRVTHGQVALHRYF